MTLSINPAGSPTDPRISTDQTPSDGKRQAPQRPNTPDGGDAAYVTISASAASESWAATKAENLAAAGTELADVDEATAFVKQLAGQIVAQGTTAGSAHAQVSARTALNVLR